VQKPAAGKVGHVVHLEPGMQPGQTVGQLARWCVGLHLLFACRPSTALLVERAESDAHSGPIKTEPAFSDIAADSSGPCGYGLRLMAECTALLYGRGLACGCWRKVRSLESSGMKASMLQHGNACLLGFSGQVKGLDKFERGTLGYIRDHDPVLSETVCGSQLARGFVSKAKEMLGLSVWTAFANKLAADGCRGGVTVLGTSLGGALAEIVAGCANRGQLDELQGAGLPSFHVDRLFTFGAPPTAVVPIANRNSGRKDDECFPGKRIFLNSPSGSTDLVAYSTSLSGYSHARQDAFQLMEMPGGNFNVTLHPCKTAETAAVPSWTMIYPALERIVRNGGWDVTGELKRYVEANHVMDAYLHGLDNTVESPENNVNIGARLHEQPVSVDPIMAKAVQRIAQCIAAKVGNTASNPRAEAMKT